MAEETRDAAADAQIDADFTSVMARAQATLIHHGGQAAAFNDDLAQKLALFGLGQEPTARGEEA